jgi:TRAP transporter TAXI family solute receptor
MKEKIKVFSIGSLCCLCIWLGLTSVSGAQGSKVPAKPAMFVFSDMEIGSSAYVNYQALGQGILKTFNIKLRVLPFTGTESSVHSVLTGVSMTFTTNPGMFYVQEGMYEYGSRNLGPKPVRMIYQCYRFTGAGLFTTLDSTIKTAADMKGKKVLFFLGNPGMQTYVDIVLAFGGLTWKDVKRVNVSGLKNSYEAIKSGAIDVAMSAATTGGAYEVASSPGGLRWIPMPKDDVEGWKRVKAITPVFSPQLCELGANISKDKPVWLATNHYPILCGLASLEEDTAYWIVKAITESYDAYKDIIPEVMKGWPPDNALGKGAAHVIPWHTGSVRYFKEKGLWTQEYEQLQQKNLARQDKLKKAWDEACKEADEKGIKGEGWMEFWSQKRQAIK